MKVKLSYFFLSVILSVLGGDAKKIVWCKIITIIPRVVHIELLAFFRCPGVVSKRYVKATNNVCLSLGPMDGGAKFGKAIVT